MKYSSSIVFIAISFLVAKELPTKYYLTENSSVMSVAMRGNVAWSETFDGETLAITLAGKFSDFVIKRISYNFKEGAIKTFAMYPSHPDTEKIIIQLRARADYKIYQNSETKRFVIELFTNKASVGGTSFKIPREKPRTKKPALAPVNISQIAQQQVDEQNTQEVERQTIKNSVSENNKEKSVLTQYSALLLILLSALIIIGGSGIIMYMLLKRKNIFPETKRQETAHAQPSDPSTQVLSCQHDADKFCEEDEHSIEFAEQYTRTQGELELQARLEQLHSNFLHQRIGKASAAKNIKKQNQAATAQQLGVSIGEIELASRLRQFQNNHHANNSNRQPQRVEETI